MIYLSLSVSNIEDTIFFYTKALGIFDSIADTRLICNTEVELIIDLFEIGNEAHQNTFGIDTHAPSNMSISQDCDVIAEHLKEFDIPYEFKTNIAGEFLKVLDPTENIISFIGGQ